MTYNVSTLSRNQLLQIIRLTMISLDGKLSGLQENYNSYHENYSEEALLLYNESFGFASSVKILLDTEGFDILDDESLKIMATLSLKVSEAYTLGVKIPEDQKELGIEKIQLSADSWKVYLDKDKVVTKVEYGKDREKVQIIYSDGKVSNEIEMAGKEYEGKGFAKKLLTAAGIETTKKSDEEMQNRMLDDGLFYINKEEGWIEKEKYFARMTPNDFLIIQDYKDVTVKAVYDDSIGKLTFTYTVGGKTENLFVIDASNNQREREWPTKSGNNVTNDPNDIMYTTPPYGKSQVPYIPGKFPIGDWHITNFEYNGYAEYGSYKIRTDAWRMVEVWELVNNKQTKVKEWKKKQKSDGTIEMAEDAGLLIHGGGYSESDLDNKKGSNKYTDNTLGCIRISNLDVMLIVKILQKYLSIKKNIDLKVS